MVYDRIKQQMMDTLPFVRLLGIRIDAIGNGTSEVSMPADPKLNNHLGTQHAGALFTLAETASGAAMAGAFADLILGLRPVAKESRIQYQKVAKGATRASGRVPGDIKALKAALSADGKVAFPVEVDVFDEHGTLAAQVQVDWYLSEKR
ncbi:YiiD C-terminal domain-containing protein [Massilia sp. CCM 9210]|uniref:PaaI family thioesterase n=1 Tax=Massilia scottii TaxID=3057166 RepID=UPI002796DAE2|nr:YiiD C-terminal domain-containing protein [Massilia sp. CCM 9210]MDQ1814551.1 YiiD C-terminal domain-containing protein [Massilia sp. CCM 9210]